LFTRPVHREVIGSLPDYPDAISVRAVPRPPSVPVYHPPRACENPLSAVFCPLDSYGRR